MLLERSMRFESGRLFVFEPMRVVAFRAWPEPGIWSGDDMARCRVPLHDRIGVADFEHVAGSGDRERAAACRALLETLPDSIGEDALRFPEHGWRLLKLVWDAPDALEMIRSNPALAFAVACAADLKTRVDDGAWPDPREVVRRKRESIAEWLELPGTPSAVRILAKLTHETIHLRGLRALRTLLSSADDPLRKLMEHVPGINADVLEILRDPELVARVAPSFLEDVSLIRSAGAHVAARLRDAIRDHGEARMVEPFPYLRTMLQFERHLTRIRGMENYRRLHREQQQDRPRNVFPAPPIPGTDNIQPLVDSEALIDEGIHQRNCAGDYGSRVSRGGLYLYRVMLPERCTLSLRKFGNVWGIDQLRIKCNELAKPRTNQIVQRWLDENQRPIGPSA